MLKNSFYRLIILVFMGMALFLFFDAISVLLSSLLVFFKTETFSFDWRKIPTSFFRSGYIGGIILGVGLWVKHCLQERKNKKESNE